MKIVRIGASFALTFLFMILLLVNELSFVTSSTLLNSQYYSQTLTQVGYYDHLGTEIEKGLVSIGLATGLPKEVLQNSIDRPWLELEGNHYVASLINYLSLQSDTIDYEFDSRPLETKLTQAIVSYAQQQGMTLTQEAQTSLNALLIKNVQQRIVVINPQNPILSNLRHYTAMIVLYKVYGVISSLLILLCLFFVNKREPYKFVNWLAYSFIATGFFLVIPATILLVSSVLTRLALHDVYLRQAIGAILERFVSLNLYTGLATIIIGILLVFASYKASPSNHLR